MTMSPLQEEVVKAKRMQSIGELPGLLPTSTSLHGRPSIAGLSSTDTIDADDADVPCHTFQSVEMSLNKSPINVGNSEYL